MKNPKNQVFTKEDLAKYLNTFGEIYEGKKLVVGPSFVVRGNQKNYVQFVNYNLPKKTDSIYYEDRIAKAILFRDSEKVYGVKPNAIGDMRYITVPYSLALINCHTGGKLDLYKIWKAQAVSDNLKSFLYELMVQAERFIKDNAPGSLYGEWAKKEECWLEIKKHDFNVDFRSLKSDLIDPKSSSNRKKITDEEAEIAQIKSDIELIRSVSPKIWGKIEEWGRATNVLTDYQQTIAWNLARLRPNLNVTDNERIIGLKIIGIVQDNNPEILFENDETEDNTTTKNVVTDDITVDLIKNVVAWDKRAKRLKPHEYLLMADLADSKKTLTDRNIELAGFYIVKAKKYGFTK